MEGDSKVLLGVLDESTVGYPTNWQSNQIGGQADYYVKDIASCICSVCESKQVFVCQVYCPLEGSPYHRTLYVYACVNKSCMNQSKSWTVLRCQEKVPSSQSASSKINTDNNWDMGGGDEWDISGSDDWGADGGQDWGSDQLSQQSKEDVWCKGANNWGDMEEDTKPNVIENQDSKVLTDTANDKSVDQREEEVVHGITEESDIVNQMEDMSIDEVPVVPATDNKDETKTQCIAEEIKFNTEQEVLTSILNIKTTTEIQNEEKIHSDTLSRIINFDSYFISVFEEPVKNDDYLKHEKKLLLEYTRREGLDLQCMESAPEPLEGKSASRKKKGGSSSGGAEGYEKGVARHGDVQFQKFTKRLALCREQILRYQWCGSPLYISKLTGGPVPACPHCGQERVFEFQLMPSLISCLHSPTQPQVQLEFGTVLIYTCRGSCWQEAEVGRQEHVIVQSDPDQHLFK